MSQQQQQHGRELAPPVFMRHMQHQRDPLPGIGLQQPPQQHLSTPSPGFGGGSPTSMGSSGTTLLPLGQDGGATSGEASPHKALEESPMAVVGSLAVARRRARNQQQQQGGGSVTSSPEHYQHSNNNAHGSSGHPHGGGDTSPRRSPSPPNAGTPTAESSYSTTGVVQQLQMADNGGDASQQQHHHHQHNHPHPSKKTLNALLDVLDPDTDGSTIVDMLPRHNSGGIPAPQQQQQQQQPPSGPSPTHFQRSFQ